MCMDGRVKKNNTEYTYYGVFFNLKKEWNFDTFYNKCES